MKNKKTILLLTGAMLLLFSQALFSISYTIVSVDEIVTVEDETVPITWLEPDIEGSTILSWDEGVSGGAGGFADISLNVPYPNGGKYKVSLFSVLTSDADKIEAVWSVEKNSTAPVFRVGTIEGLGGTSGDIITLTIDDLLAIEIRITVKFQSLFAPEEIVGQINVDGYAVENLKVVLRKKGTNENTATDPDGEYKFVGIEPDDIKKIVIGPYKNYNPDITITGYVYVGGEPLVGATVVVSNQSGDLATVTTDADGYYDSGSILDAVGADNDKIRVFITP
jgi:hypothetical protein